MSNEQTNALIDQVREIIGRLAPIGAQEQRPDDLAHPVDDLGYASLAIFELVLELGRELDLPRLQEEDVMDIATVGQVEALVAATIWSSTSSPRPAG